MKFNLLKSAAVMLAAVAGSLSVNAAWVEVKSWDFRAISDAMTDEAYNVTYGDETVTVGTGCTVATGDFAGLAFQGVEKWFVRSQAKGNGLYQGNGGDRVVAVLDLTAADKVVFTANTIDGFSGPINGELESSDTDADTSVNTLTYSVTEDGNFGVYLARYNYIYSITVLRNDGQGQEAEVTLNYVCDGKTIKTETKNLEVGDEVTLTASETADFTEDGVKYIYESNDAEGMTVAANGTVVTLTYHVAANYNWTVNYDIDGTETLYQTGVCSEGDAVTVAYPRYILNGSTLWLKDAINKEYNYTFTPDKDGYVEVLSYTATTTTDALYYSEGEYIEGMTEATGANANVRCSNSAGGYSEEGAAVAFYTLKPGTYKVTVGVWGNSGVTFSVKAGETEVLSTATAGWWFDTTSEEFTVSEETPLTIEGPDANHPLDYVYITGTVDTSTGVEAIEAAEEEGAWYNLQGVKVAAPAKGIYIHNGKKVVVK